MTAPASTVVSLLPSLPAASAEPAFCVVMTTLASGAEAKALASQIVEARLAACVQLQAVKSFYVWEGKSRADSEYLLFIKTRQSLYAALEAFIKSRHGYEVPELVQVPITAGSAEYLGWMAEQTQQP